MLLTTRGRTLVAGYGGASTEAALVHQLDVRGRVQDGSVAVLHLQVEEPQLTRDAAVIG